MCNEKHFGSLGIVVHLERDVGSDFVDDLINFIHEVLLTRTEMVHCYL